MGLYQKAKQYANSLLLKNISDEDVMIENYKRNVHMQGDMKQASTGIIPLYNSNRLISLKDWNNALNLAQNPHTLSRWRLYEMYDNVMLDLHLSSIVETRILELQGVKYKLMNQAGKEEIEGKKMLEAQWYLDYIKYAWEHTTHAHSLIEMMETEDEFSTIKLSNGTFSYKALKCVTLINRAHVRPEKGKWIVNTFDPIEAGYDYTQPPYSYYYISVGKKDDLGLLKKISPVVLAKRYALGSWSEYNEKLGIPFRYVNMKGTNKTREGILAKILTAMGSAGWGVFHEGEELKLLENKSNDVHKCFKELIELCNAENSKMVLGSTMTVDAAGGQYKGEVHERTTEIRHQADKTFIQYLNNKELIPRLIKMGYPMKGLSYQLDDKEELSITEQIAVDTVLLTYYTIDPKYIADKYDIPEEMIAGKTPQNIQDVLTENAKKKPNPAVKNSWLNSFETTILNSTEKLYYSPCSCGNTHIKPSSITFQPFKDISRIIEEIWSGKLKAGDLDEGLFQHQVQDLLNGLKEGVGQDLLTIDYNSPDAVMMESMRNNVYLFSGAKNYQELRAMTDLLIDESGNLKSKTNFIKDVMKLHDTYDKRFAAAEYDHSVVSGQAFSMWKQFENQKEQFPFLRFNAVMDAGTTPMCSVRNGITMRFGSAWWDTNMIPLHFGERSTVDQVATGEETDLSKLTLPDPKPMFKNNVGKTGIVFPEKHPYYQMSKKQMDNVQSFVDEQIKKDTSK